MEQLSTEYPAALEIDYPDSPRDWFTTLLRPLLVVPIAIILALVSGPGAHSHAETWPGAAGGILFFATALMLVFRQKYPGWWFDWNVALTAFGLRVMAYLALLRDEYPSTDEERGRRVPLVGSGCCVRDPAHDGSLPAVPARRLRPLSSPLAARPPSYPGGAATPGP